MQQSFLDIDGGALLRAFFRVQTGDPHGQFQRLLIVQAWIDLRFIGAREVRIHSEVVPVRAQVRSLGNYSAHADHSELVDWVTRRLPAHGAIFLTHGEDEERQALRAALMHDDGLASDQVLLPMLDDAFELRAEGVAGVERPVVPRVDMAQIALDWHNAYASFIIDLSRQLETAPTDAERVRVMEALKATLAGTGPVTPPLPMKTQPGPVVLHAEPGGD